MIGRDAARVYLLFSILERFVCVMRFHLISDLDLDESRVNIIAFDVFFSFQENYLI